jgi:hypothetical protein
MYRKAAPRHASFRSRWRTAPGMALVIPSPGDRHQPYPAFSSRVLLGADAPVIARSGHDHRAVSGGALLRVVVVAGVRAVADGIVGDGRAQQTIWPTASMIRVHHLPMRLPDSIRARLMLGATVVLIAFLASLSKGVSGLGIATGDRRLDDVNGSIFQDRHEHLLKSRRGRSPRQSPPHPASPTDTRKIDILVSLPQSMPEPYDRGREIGTPGPEGNAGGLVADPYGPNLRNRHCHGEHDMPPSSRFSVLSDTAVPLAYSFGFRGMSILRLRAN